MPFSRLGGGALSENFSVMRPNLMELREAFLVCLVDLVILHRTAVLEIVGSNPALAKQIITFLGLLRFPARVGL